MLAIFTSTLTRNLVLSLLFAAAVAPISAQSIDELANKGAAVAISDRLSEELHNRTSDGPNRRGFDIGMAAAEGQTLPGPGKQRIHDSLSLAEQAGCEIAVAFSLQRNKNAPLATAGGAIASADQVVAYARTAVAPGSLGIRNGLNPAAQRGFNASVSLHLSRRYQPVAKIDLNSTVTAAGKNSDRTAAALLSKVLPRVPNVVGLSDDDAHRVLSLAGFGTKATYLDTHDQSVLYDHVQSTVPAAERSLPQGSKVELLIPHPASRSGIGALGLSAVTRRDGFDLDEGRYEELRRGADMALREDTTPIPHFRADGQVLHTKRTVR